MQEISLEEAAEVLLSKAAPGATEELPLLPALGRYAAQDIVAVMDNPPFDRSPLDGYALNSSDTKDASAEHPVSLHIIGEECAGDYFASEVHRGEAVRIMTGGAMPRGTDAVIRQEDVKLSGDMLYVPYALKHRENYCLAGEDVKKGSTILRKGDRLTAARLAVLAAQGYARVRVFCRVKVFLTSTGDELIQPGEKLAPGKIYNSNFYLLAARLQELGCETELLPVLPDDAAAAADRIRPHLSDSSLILTTGGVSVGKKDIMHEVIRLLPAERLFWGVRMKPGYPLISYEQGNTIGLALSGNPFAAYTTFELLARPLLMRMAGAREPGLRRTKGVLREGFSKASKGRRFVRAFYDVSDGGVRLPEQHSSGSLFSAAGCNALVDIPAGTGPMPEGAPVELVLL